MDLRGVNLTKSHFESRQLFPFVVVYYVTLCFLMNLSCLSVNFVLFEIRLK